MRSKRRDDFAAAHHWMAGLGAEGFDQSMETGTHPRELLPRSLFPEHRRGGL